MSQNPANRLINHNTIEKGFTSRYHPWEIVYTTEYEIKEQAHLAELKVKNWKSKKMILKLIKGEITL